MEDLAWARLQMAMSGGCHVLFLAVAVALPWMIFAAEWLGLRRRDQAYLELAYRWAQGGVVLFAAGAISGTLFLFEIGLLFPGFIDRAGAVVGVPWALQGFALLCEAIFLGAYVHGRDRLGDIGHAGCALAAGMSGVIMAAAAITANAWMSRPGTVDLDDRGAMVVTFSDLVHNPTVTADALHLIPACFIATGFAMAAIHAFRRLRADARGLHRRALTIALPFATAATLVGLLTGAFASSRTFALQPTKAAAMTGQWETGPAMPLRFFSWAQTADEAGFAVFEFPDLGALLGAHSPGTPIAGLAEVPATDRPPHRLVHLAFQAMLLSAAWLTVASLILAASAYSSRRRRTRTTSQAPLGETAAGQSPFDMAEAQGGRPRRLLLGFLVASGPVGCIALESGFAVTELGRQPWLVHGVMRVEEGLTPIADLAAPFAAFSAMYLLLGLSVALLLRRLLRQSAEERGSTHDDD